MILLAVFVTALLGLIYPLVLPIFMMVSLVGVVYLFWKQKQKGFKPQSDTYKELAKLKKKRVKIDDNKHKHINDQVSYIAEVWGYTKEQEKVIKKFIETRAYSPIYNKLTASFFPQMISLIDKCNAREQKGCKREVSKRLRELTLVMKEELKKKKTQNTENFQTTLEVYDQLLYKNNNI